MTDSKKVKNMTLQDKLDFLKQIGYKYEADKGEIYNNKGKIISKKDTQGYIDIDKMCNGIKYRVRGHQLAYYLQTGIVPDVIDHIDGNPSNNIFTNLRNCSHAANAKNKKAKGCWQKKNGKWSSVIMVDYKRINLGTYSTENEATEAYNQGKLKYHGLEHRPKFA